MSEKNPLINMTQPEYDDYSPANYRGKKNYRDLGIKNEDEFYDKARERNAVLREKNNALRSTTKTITEKGAFLPKTQSAIKYATKAAKATRIGKIAATVAGVGLAAKEFLKSKMNKEEVDKKSTGGMTIGKGKDYIKDLL